MAFSCVGRASLFQGIVVDRGDGALLVQIAGRCATHMQPLKLFQDQAAGADRNLATYRSAKSGAAKWMTQELSRAITQKKIASTDWANAYKISYEPGLVVDAQGPVQKPVKAGLVPNPELARKPIASFKPT